MTETSPDSVRKGFDATGASQLDLECVELVGVLVIYLWPAHRPIRWVDRVWHRLRGIERREAHVTAEAQGLCVRGTPPPRTE